MIMKMARLLIIMKRKTKNNKLIIKMKKLITISLALSNLLMSFAQKKEIKASRKGT